MTSSTQVNEVFSQIASKNLEAFSLWADVNQRVVQELVNFSASTAKEGVRLYAEVQLAAIEAVKDSQGFLLRRQADMQDAPRDPLAWYQRTVMDTLDGTQRAFKLFEGQAQAVTRSTERVQAAAEQSAKEIQSTFTHFADEMRSLYAPIAEQPGKVRGQKAA